MLSMPPWSENIMGHTPKPKNMTIKGKWMQLAQWHSAAPVACFLSSTLTVSRPPSPRCRPPHRIQEMRQERRHVFISNLICPPPLKPPPKPAPRGALTCPPMPSAPPSETMACWWFEDPLKTSGNCWKSLPPKHSIFPSEVTYSGMSQLGQSKKASSTVASSRSDHPLGAPHRAPPRRWTTAPSRSLVPSTVGAVHGRERPARAEPTGSGADVSTHVNGGRGVEPTGSGSR